MTEENLTKNKDYFDDDEYFINDDALVLEENEVSIIKQDENYISVELNNFYKDDGKSARNKFGLKNDPPILSISSSDGDQVDFLVTENLANVLAKDFKNISRAYAGISVDSKKEKKSFKENWDSVVQWMRDNKIKTILIAFVLLLIVYGMVQF